MDHMMLVWNFNTKIDAVFLKKWLSIEGGFGSKIVICCVYLILKSKWKAEQ